MAVSIISLLLWTALAPWMIGRLNTDPLGFQVIAWTHLVTLGVIGTMIIGASIQLVPVALQTPFEQVKLAYWFWIVWCAGLVLFIVGFAADMREFLVPGATLLGLVLLGYAFAITSMVRSAPHRDTVAWHLLVASWFAVMGFVLGWLLALTNVNGILGGRLLPVLAAHILCMVVGWIALTLIGVGYKLIGMFTLAERSLHQRTANASAGLITVGTVFMVSGLTFSLWKPISVLGSVAILVGVLVAAREVVHMYHRRMRKAIDVHMPFALTALAVMMVTAVMLVWLTFQSQPLIHRLSFTAVWLVMTGCFLVAIQGFFFKISTFLIWLHVYAPMAGKVEVPKLDTMYDRRLAFLGLGFWMAGVVAVALGIQAVLPMAWWLTVPLILGAILFAVNVARIVRALIRPGVSSPGPLSPTDPSRPPPD